MADPTPSMVMRSVYLPPEMDDTLRNLAFQLRLSKADLIRTFVTDGLNDVIRRLGPAPDEAKIASVVQRLSNGKLPDAELERGRLDVERLRVAAAQSRRSYASP